MLRKIPWTWAMLYATLALLGVASYFKWTSMWGINHLAFLPGGWWLVYWVTVAIVTLLAGSRDPTPRLDRALDAISDWLFERGVWPKVTVAAAFTLSFIVFRSSVPLLGDGYTWLAIFGSGNQYISKWAELGGIWLLRGLQAVQGEYTTDTALLGFRLTSIISGSIYVLIALRLIPELIHHTRMRLLGLILLIGSGILVMFFGYPEFYPPIWPIALGYVYCLVRGESAPKWLWLAGGLLAFGTLMHVQMIVLLPGLIYAFVHRASSRGLSAKLLISISVLATLGGLGLWIVLSRPETALMLLPLFTGRSIAPGYSIFSAIHSLDLLNLALVVCPSLFPVLVVVARTSKRQYSYPDLVLFMLAIGSSVFAVWYGAAITMARDWDVMAFGLIGPLVLFAGSLNFCSLTHTRFLTSVMLAGAFVTTSYVAVCTTTTPAESRFFSLLNERTRSGWVVLSNYYNLKGDTSKAKEVSRAMAEHFPDYKLLAEAYARLERKDIEGAHNIARRLVSKDSAQPDFLQILANTHGMLGRTDSADYFYRKAIAYNPYNNVVYNEYGQLLMSAGDHDSAVVILTKANSLPPARSFIRESLALAYLQLERYPEALAVADTLFSDDPNSPGGHLISMIIDIRRNDLQSARSHYEAYLVSGQSRSDYQGIRKYYAYLTQ